MLLRPRWSEGGRDPSARVRETDEYRNLNANMSDHATEPFYGNPTEKLTFPTKQNTGYKL